MIRSWAEENGMDSASLEEDFAEGYNEDCMAIDDDAVEVPLPPGIKFEDEKKAKFDICSFKSEQEQETTSHDRISLHKLQR